jgi:hypothetical protein
MSSEADYNRSVSRYPCIRLSPFRRFVEWASTPATPAFVPAFFVLCGAGAFACQRGAHP